MAKEKNSLCWECKNSVPGGIFGCSWSRKFQPVKGWTAERRELRSSSGRTGDFIESYTVKKCPLFERERRKEESQ